MKTNRQFVVNAVNSAVNLATLNVNSNGTLTFTRANFTPSVDIGILINCTYFAD